MRFDFDHEIMKDFGSTDGPSSGLSCPFHEFVFDGSSAGWSAQDRCVDHSDGESTTCDTHPADQTDNIVHLIGGMGCTVRLWLMTVKMKRYSSYWSKMELTLPTSMYSVTGLSLGWRTPMHRDSNCRRVVVDRSLSTRENYLLRIDTSMRRRIDDEIANLRHTSLR